MSALALGVAAICLAVPASEATAANTEIAKCAKRVSKSVRRFSEDYLGAVKDCRVDNLGGDDLDCLTDEDVLKDIDKTAEKASREVEKCGEDVVDALCPLEGDTVEGFMNGLQTGPLSLQGRMEGMMEDAYVTSYAPGCPRPALPLDFEDGQEECAKRVGRAIEEAVEDFQKCFFGCTLNEMRRSNPEPCVDENGAAFDDKVIECQEGVEEDIREALARKCEEDQWIVDLGCPMNSGNVDQLGDNILARSLALVEWLNKDMFTSSCRSGLAGEEGEVVPATATLLPSNTTVEINCGDVLDGAFFGSDVSLQFESNLDCSPLSEATNGIVVAQSGVTVSGNSKKYNIIGPTGSSNRTETGILVAPGAHNVIIKDFKSVDFFGVGIGDSGDNINLTIEKSRVRRNTIAGVRTTSVGVELDEMEADRNAIGFDLSGDDTTLRDSRARRSESGAGIGIMLGGTDDDFDGRVVRVTECEIDENFVGIVTSGGPAKVEQNEIRSNLDDGVVFGCNSGVFDDNSIKLNGGDGVVVSGDANNITANRSDENLGYGFVISGDANSLDGNGSGTLTDRGNETGGYLISGTGSDLSSNRAEANDGPGFIVTGVTAAFESNDSAANTGVGFDIVTSGVTLDSNVAEDNGGPEFVIAAGNTDGAGNRANGSTISFDGAGGSFE